MQHSSRPEVVAPLVMALDGGGTKLACAVADGAGRLLAFQRGKPVNPNFVPVEQVDANVAATVSAVLRCIHAPIRVVVVAGAIPDRGLEPIKSSMASEAQIVRVTESDFGLYSEHGLSEAVVVIAGTGSSATAYRSDGEQVVVGGGGTILGDEGSGYWIGVEALKACLRALDGRGEPTVLWDFIREEFNIHSAAELMRLVYRGDLRHRDRVAALTVLVCRGAQEGDGVARGILTRAGEELAHLAATAAKRLELDPSGLRCLGVGGVFRAGAMILDPMQTALDTLYPGARVQRARWEPITGGLGIGLRMAGSPLSEEQLGRLGSQIDDANLVGPVCSKGAQV